MKKKQKLDYAEIKLPSKDMILDNQVSIFKTQCEIIDYINKKKKKKKVNLLIPKQDILLGKFRHTTQSMALDYNEVQMHKQIRENKNG